MPMRGSGALQFNSEDAYAIIRPRLEAGPWNGGEGFWANESANLNDAIALLSTEVGRNTYVRDIDNNGRAIIGIVIQQICRFLLAE